MPSLKQDYYHSRLNLGPTYTIRDLPPWLLDRSQSEGAAAPALRPASSTYSLDLEAMDDDIHVAASLNPASAHQEIPDAEAHQSRTSRLPIFKQVRSMLSNSRGMPTNTSPTSAIKWDEYSGEISEHGKEARVKPSTYRNPYEGLLKPRRQSPSRASRNTQRSMSPVSMLVDSELQMLEQQEQQDMSPPSSRPVSPIAEPPVYVAPLVLARPKTSGDVSRLKRKPVAATHDPHDVRPAPSSSHGEPTQTDPSSRFSWTTIAPSEAPRQSIGSRFSRQNRAASEHDSHHHSSHFSWSTVASAVPGAMREQTPPPSPPPVPVQYLEQSTYAPPPTQSILSRQRPYKRVEKPEWAPPPAPVSEGWTPRSLTPKVSRIEQHPTSTTPTPDGKKRLPLPPLFTEKSLSHLEALLTQEKNVLLQKRNIERSIAELERVESASPLEVSFAVVREAKKKLGERRKVLDEIRLEEMDVGIRIARARRKEDFADGEGTFWVRRVTG